MLLNNPVAHSGTYFFWRVYNNTSGTRVYVGPLRFVSGGVTYPPTMTNNTTPSPYIASNQPFQYVNPSGTAAYASFAASLTSSSLWETTALPAVITLYTGPTPLAKPTSVSVGVGNINPASQGPKDIDFLMGTDSNIANATLLLQIRDQTWTNSTPEQRSFTIP